MSHQERGTYSDNPPPRQRKGVSWWTIAFAAAAAFGVYTLWSNVRRRGAPLALQPAAAPTAAPTAPT